MSFVAAGPGLRAGRSDFDLQRQPSLPLCRRRCARPNWELFIPPFFEILKKSISLLYYLFSPSIAIQVSMYQRERRSRSVVRRQCKAILFIVGVSLSGMESAVALIENDSMLNVCRWLIYCFWLSLPLTLPIPLDAALQYFPRQEYFYLGDSKSNHMI